MANIAKLPPQNIDAEESLLGSLLIDKEAIVKVAEILSPADFYRSETHGKIYAAILELFEKREPVDLVTVTDKLRQNNSLDLVGGSAYLTTLVNSVPTSAHVESYAKIIKENATRRSLIVENTRLVEKAYDLGVPLEVLVDEAEQSIFSISQQRIRKDFVSIKDLLTVSFDRLDELQKSAGKMRGVPTGFRDLDNKLAGLQDSNLIIFAARPGQGKCLASDSKIVNPQTGEVKTIGEYFKEGIKPILTLDERLKIAECEVSRFVDDGFKEVYQVKTSTGREIEVTSSHPFLTTSGWRKLEDIQEGEYIATPRALPYFGNASLADYKVILMAYSLTDGLERESNLKIATDFSDSINSFTDGIFNSWFPLISSAGQAGILKKDTTYYDLRGVTLLEEEGPLIKMKKNLSLGLENLSDLDSQTVITSWLAELNMLEKQVENRKIPKIIFKLPKEKIGLFLNRLFASNGKVNYSVLDTSITYSALSKDIAYDVQHLLLRFQIISTVKSNVEKIDSSRFDISINDPLSLMIFCKEIGILGKDSELGEIWNQIRTKMTDDDYLDEILPDKLWEYVDQIRKISSSNKVNQKVDLKAQKIKKRKLTRSYLLYLAKALESYELELLGSSDIFWDQIKSIKSVGQKQVYDLTINQTHNFVANDFFVHNTSFVLNVAEYVSVKAGLPVGIFSLEMSQEELVDRLLVSQAEIDAWKLKTGKLDEKDFDRLSHAMGQLAEAPLFIDDTPGMSMAEIRTKARRLQMEHGLRLIIVDYLQLIHGRNLENRVQEVSEISQSLKNLARELKVPVFALSQLSRAVENRGTRKPQLADLRESGAIEQDADVVMFIYREDAENLSDVTLDIQKHRNGPTGEIKLVFVPERVRFYGMEKSRSTPVAKKSDNLTATAA